MRVLFVKEGRELYGAEQATFRLMRSLKRSNLEAEILVREYQPQPSPFLEAVIGLEMPVYVAASDAELGARMKELAPTFDALVTIGYKCHVLGWWHGRNFPWMRFGICHGWVDSDLKMRAYNSLARACLKRSDGVMVVSPTIKVSNPHVTCIFNGVNVTELTNAASEPIEPYAEDPIVLFVGRLEREKGLKELVDAFYPLKDGASLVLLGDGPMRKELEQTITKYGMTDDVTFLGFQRNPMPYLTRAAVLVMPSWSEGTPLVVLEAMALRVPVVATSVGAIPAMIDHKWEGWLVDARNVEELRRGIKRVIADPEGSAEWASNAYDRVIREFTTQAVADRVESFILKRLRSRES